MIKLTIISDGKPPLEIKADSRFSLRQILFTNNVLIRSGCVGNGSCGLCKVKILGKNVNKPTPNERILLGKNDLSQGVRLACQVYLQDDLQIEIHTLSLETKWYYLQRTQIFENDFSLNSDLLHLIDKQQDAFGLAIDLGTTTIRLSIYNLKNGKFQSGRLGYNPQLVVGDNVLTRLQNASESPELAQKLKDLVIQAIGDALLDISLKEGINIQQLFKVTVVGNTAMLALLTGENYHLLLNSAYWSKPIECRLKEPKSMIDILRINSQSIIDVIQPISGFVGSDLLAGIVATNLTRSKSVSLFIDFGTNSEIALWNGEELWITSAAGGPAFEGGGISCGMPAVSGAISTVKYNEDSQRFDTGTIDNKGIKGICGSGLVDLIAELNKINVLTEKGNFANSEMNNRFTLKENNAEIFLTKKDVDAFQRAKAAIGVGIRVLLSKKSLSIQEVKRIHIGGAFGQFINVNNAQQIGLLPIISKEGRIDFCGNTALLGCETVLFSSKIRREMKKIRNYAKIVNLALSPRFDELYLENLFLKVM